MMPFRVRVQNSGMIIRLWQVHLEIEAAARQLRAAPSNRASERAPCPWADLARVRLEQCLDLLPCRPILTLPRCSFLFQWVDRDRSLPPADAPHDALAHPLSSAFGTDLKDIGCSRITEKPMKRLLVGAAILCLAGSLAFAQGGGDSGGSSGGGS